MASRRIRQAVLRLAIPFVALSLALTAVGSVAANAPGPATIQVVQTGSMSVDASGTWSWPEMATASKLSYTGFAIDWGDVTSGNAVGSYHVGDGTAATNGVMQSTSPAQGSSGSWGKVSHTYANAGTYKVCVIVYDLGEVTPFKTTGYHSLQAGGTDRNTDNSVDLNSQVPGMCATVDVAAPSATPFQSFQGETSQPTGTPPSTSTDSLPSNPNQGLPMLPLILLVGSGILSVLVFKTAKVRA